MRNIRDFNVKKLPSGEFEVVGGYASTNVTRYCVCVPSEEENLRYSKRPIP